jgi:hypothetical protein
METNHTRRQISENWCGLPWYSEDRRDLELKQLKEVGGALCELTTTTTTTDDGVDGVVTRMTFGR